MSGAGGDTATARPASAIGGLNSWVLPLAEVKSWFASARPGERLVYAHGPRLMHGETSRYVGQLALAGLADPVQPRSPGGIGFDFTVQKRSTAADAVGSAARAGERAGEEDAAIDVILRALRRCANMGQRAPSNTELARAAGLATAAQAAWRLAKLHAAGKIRIRTVTTGKEAGWRVITIVGRGPSGDKSTKAPPSWERAAHQARQEVAR